ncbi:hypothetical protein EON62_03075 [archaeon]|nr:MAG: hypothetical protein EON62_03075 [archaeon]
MHAPVRLPYLQVTVAHCIIGLRILVELVGEMNYKNRNRTMTQHRKVAVSFRDTSLFQTFDISLNMLNQVATRSISFGALPPAEAGVLENKMLELALQLLISCLSFDFIGANPDDDSEPTAIQVPATWRDRLQTGSALRLLFNLYRGCTTGRISIIPDALPPAPTAAASSLGSRSALGSSSGPMASAGAGFGGFGGAPFQGGFGATSTRDMAVSPARAMQGTRAHPSSHAHDARPRCFPLAAAAYTSVYICVCVGRACSVGGAVPHGIRAPLAVQHGERSQALLVAHAARRVRDSA